MYLVNVRDIDVLSKFGRHNNTTIDLDNCRLGSIDHSILHVNNWIEGSYIVLAPEFRFGTIEEIKVALDMRGLRCT